MTHDGPSGRRSTVADQYEEALSALEWLERRKPAPGTPEHADLIAARQMLSDLRGQLHLPHNAEED